MSRLRTALTVVVVALLCAGYASSQLALFEGRAPDWAAFADRPPIHLLANAVLALCAVLFLFRDRGEEADRP